MAEQLTSPVSLAGFAGVFDTRGAPPGLLEANGGLRGRSLR